MLDVYILGDESLLVGRIRGILDLRAATKLIELVEIKEEELQHGFDRVCDLTHLEGIQLTEKEVQSLATRRRNHNPNPIRVKSAFIATEPLSRSIACMYQAMVASDRITVGVFDSYESAAAWLQVTPEKLKL